MLLKAIAIAASVAGILATTPVAPAAAAQADWEYFPRGNCPQGMFCVYPNYDHPEQGPTTTPTLVTKPVWTGRVPAATYYNGIGQNVKVIVSFVWNGVTHQSEECGRTGGHHLYMPMEIVEVSLNPRYCG